MFVAYLGVDPLTGKQKRTTRRGFKTKRDAKIAKARLQAEIEEKIFSIAPKQMTFQKVYNVWLPVYNTTIKEKVSTKYNKMSSDYTYFQNLIR